MEKYFVKNIHFYIIIWYNQKTQYSDFHKLD